MTSQVSICNQALDELGKDNISDLLEDSTGARKCRQHYDQVLDTLLQSYPWKFAGKYQAMAAIAVVTVRSSFWTYAFVRPADCLKIRRIIPSIETTDAYEGPAFELSDTTFFTHDPTGYLDYTQRVTDVTKFPPMFIDALAAALAARMAMPLTQSFKVKTDMIAVQQKYWNLAVTADANEARDTSDFASEMIAARA